ncbi:MAG: hypothetical protein V4573_10975 [Pseudomonadota bacterium]
MDYFEIAKYVATFLAGLGTGWAVNIKVSASKNQSRDKVVFTNNKVGGDQAGRDINKR